MKYTRLIRLMLSLSFVFLFAACSDDSDDDGGGGSVNCATFLTDDLLALSTALQTASTAYSEDASTANCNAVVVAYQEFIDAYQAAIDKCGSDPVYGAAFTGAQAAIDQAEASLALVDCDG